MVSSDDLLERRTNHTAGYHDGFWFAVDTYRTGFDAGYQSTVYDSTVPPAAQQKTDFGHDAAGYGSGYVAGYRDGGGGWIVGYGAGWARSEQDMARFDAGLVASLMPIDEQFAQPDVLFADPERLTFSRST